MKSSYKSISKNKWCHWLASLLLLLLLLTVAAIFLHIRFITLSSTDRMRLEMYKSTLYSTKEQHHILPYILSKDNIIKQAILQPDKEIKINLNKHLEYYNDNLKTAAIFILDLHGKAIASSNWKASGSYVNHNYNYRPYYKQAMEGKSGQFYGFGGTTNIPGLFLSTGIKHNGNIIGIVVVKISLDKIEYMWSEGPEHIVIADENDIIFLSSKPQWQLKSLQPLLEQTKEKLQSTRQYSVNTLQQANYYPCFNFNGFVFFKKNKDQLCFLPDYYAHQVNIQELGWKMMMIVPLGNFYWVLIITLFISASTHLLILTFIKYWRIRLRTQILLTQANETLELQVKERTKALETVNQKLVKEIKERHQAEQVLQVTRSELAESNKLAALGQMATEIAHEQNQPLAAMRALTDNTRVMLSKGMYEQVDQNLKYTTSVIERMTQLISELKSFASRHRVPKGSANLVKTLYSAVSLLNHSLNKNHVERRINTPSIPLFVGCDELGLGQIFSNLISNSLDSMENETNRRLDIAIRRVDQRVIVTLKDSGPGFSPEAIDRIFEPFFTTKRRGMGLGLAIVSEIVRNSNGTIEANNHPQGGAIITLSWPDWEEHNNVKRQ